MPTSTQSRLTRFPASSTELQNAIACAARVFELMEAEPQEPDSPDAIELTQVKGAVELKNVSFSYVPEQKLTGISIFL